MVHHILACSFFWDFWSTICHSTSGIFTLLDSSPHFLHASKRYPNIVLTPFPGGLARLLKLEDLTQKSASILISPPSFNFMFHPPWFSYLRIYSHMYVIFLWVHISPIFDYNFCSPSVSPWPVYPDFGWRHYVKSASKEGSSNLGRRGSFQPKAIPEES